MNEKRFEETNAPYPLIYGNVKHSSKIFNLKILEKQKKSLVLNTP